MPHIMSGLHGMAIGCQKWRAIACCIVIYMQQISCPHLGNKWVDADITICRTSIGQYEIPNCLWLSMRPLPPADGEFVSAQTTGSFVNRSISLNMRIQLIIVDLSLEELSWLNIMLKYMPTWHLSIWLEIEVFRVCSFCVLLGCEYEIGQFMGGWGNAVYWLFCDWSIVETLVLVKSSSHWSDRMQFVLICADMWWFVLEFTLRNVCCELTFFPVILMYVFFHLVILVKTPISTKLPSCIESVCKILLS